MVITDAVVGNVVAVVVGVKVFNPSPTYRRS